LEKVNPQILKEGLYALHQLRVAGKLTRDQKNIIAKEFERTWKK